jgi:hypothetical protein
MTVGNSSPRARAVLLLTLLFVLGVLIGALGMNFWGGRLMPRSRWPYTHTEFFSKLSHDVGLSATQQDQLRLILDDSASRFHAIDDQVRPARNAIRLDARARIRALLSPDQQPKLDEFFRQIDKERQQAEANR